MSESGSEIASIVELFIVPTEALFPEVLLRMTLLDDQCYLGLANCKVMAVTHREMSPLHGMKIRPFTFLGVRDYARL